VQLTDLGLTDIDLSDIDLTDMDRFKLAFPHEWFTYLRREAPVWFHPPTDEVGNERGFWVVTKYEDVVAVSRDWQTFSSEKAPAADKGGVMLPDIGPESGVGTMMLMMDPPQHTRYRKIVSSAFTPRVVRLFEQQIRRRTAEIVDSVIERGEADFVTDIAAELPLQAIAEILGVPQDDRNKLFDWTNKMVGSSDPEYVVPEDEFANVSVEMFTYANSLGQEKRDAPKDDIVTAIVNAAVEGEQLTEMEFDMFFMLLTVAGNETTRNAITHGMQAFFEHPDQWRVLRDDPSLLDSAAEEIVRWASPVIYFRRSVTRDTELRGHQMKAGDKITVWYPSANRDEDVFDAPFAFDVARDPNPHIGFGGRGPHFCLGSNLARLEIKVMFEELLRRVPDIAPAADPDRLRSNFINGIKHLPVTFTPGPRAGAA
jgi:cholest-4-en-3-one 26-monooxygenase